MRNTTTKLLASAAIMALALGTASQAKAFDGVDWNWNKTITQTEDINITVDSALDWSGLVEVEKIQENIGDITAKSSVHDISNNAPITVDGDRIVARDAVDLPSILSTATAVGNNQNIDSSVAVNLHDAQYNFGGFGELSGPPTTEFPQIAFAPTDLLFLGVADLTDNPHTDGLIGLTLAGALGIITQGEVDATSKVHDITNASVDSSATAVGNNLNVNVDASTAGDATLIADLTQFNYANVSATSTVCDIDVNNYGNLGVLDGALVSSVATAVGNNVSITVNSPDVGGVDGGAGGGGAEGQ